MRLFAWLFVFMVLLAGATRAQQNVLLIIADDIGVDRIGAYAEHPDPGRTPAIDGLAASGVLFRNAWSSPTCSPARATIPDRALRLPHRHWLGHRALERRGGAQHR